MRYLIFLLCLLTGQRAFAQMGAKASYLLLNKDLGKYYNNAAAPELYYVNDDVDDLLRVRAGITYTNLQAKDDSFSIFQKQFPLNTLVMGSYVPHKLTLTYVYADISYPVVRISDFALYAGIGLEAIKTHVQYDLRYDGSNPSYVNSKETTIGYRLTSGVTYKINPHFDALIDATTNRFGMHNISDRGAHTTLSVGLNYFIRARTSD